jgi:hypothetical protein
VPFLRFSRIQPISRVCEGYEGRGWRDQNFCSDTSVRYR